MQQLKLTIVSTALLGLFLVLQGCTRTATPTPFPTQPVDETPLPTSTPTPTAVLDLAVEVVAKELKVPWAIDFAPDGRIFVAEREGTIRTVVEGQVQHPPYAEIEVAQEGDNGLLGLALDPDFESNGYLYVYHTYRTPRGLLNRVVRLEDAGARGQNTVTILDGIPAAHIHNGGRIKFGPDGKLYITTGDAAAPPLAQDIDSLAGKILRINKDGSVPLDNPFPGSPVYSYGHRNPQGLAWHPVTGQLFATEQGPLGNDEVNRIMAGSNYGWPDVIGISKDSRFRDPILLSGVNTWTPSGAAFYDGNVLPPEWKGRLLFGALRGQRIVWLTLRPPESDAILNQGTLFGRRFGRIHDVVLGPDGHIYFTTSNLDGQGRPREGDDLILRIVPVKGTLGYVPGDQVDSP